MDAGALIWLGLAWWVARLVLFLGTVGSSPTFHRVSRFDAAVIREQTGGANLSSRQREAKISATCPGLCALS